jgi:hypothetical protein
MEIENFNPIGWAIAFAADVEAKRISPTDIPELVKVFTKVYLRGKQDKEAIQPVPAQY